MKPVPPTDTFAQPWTFPRKVLLVASALLLALLGVFLAPPAMIVLMVVVQKLYVEGARTKRIDSFSNPITSFASQ